MPFQKSRKFTNQQTQANHCQRKVVQNTDLTTLIRGGVAGEHQKSGQITPLRSRHDEIKQVTQSWLKSKVIPDGKYLFITLTLKQGQVHQNGVFEKLTTEAADRSVAFLFKNIERDVFGSAAKRFGKHLQRAVFEEGGDKNSEIRIHRHLCVAVPDDYVTAEMLATLFRHYWAKAYWAMRSGSTASTAIHIEEARSPDVVIEYISKNGIEAFCPFTSRL